MLINVNVYIQKKKGIKIFYLLNFNDNFIEFGFKLKVNYFLYSYFKVIKLNDLFLFSLIVKLIIFFLIMESS